MTHRNNTFFFGDGLDVWTEEGSDTTRYTIPVRTSAQYGGSVTLGYVLPAHSEAVAVNYFDGDACSELGNEFVLGVGFGKSIIFGIKQNDFENMCIHLHRTSKEEMDEVLDAVEQSFLSFIKKNLFGAIP